VDRDEKIVDAALDAFNFCKLLNLGVFERHRSLARAPIAGPPTLEPHTRECRLLENGYPMLRVSDEQPGAAWTRPSGAVVDVGGVKAYQVELRLHDKPVGCSELIPLSFVRAVRFEFGPGWLQDNARCNILRDFAAAAARVLPKDLVYPPDGQDTPAVGACANRIAANPADCGPAVDVRVPGDLDAILAAGAHDPNVACAVFRNAVVAGFGDAFTPVVTSDSCLFVEPRHRVQIDVGATAEGDAPNAFGKDPKRWKDRQIVSLGGRDAVVFRAVRGAEFWICASPRRDLGTRGLVRLVVAALPARGIDTMEAPSVSTEDVLRAEMVVQSVLGRYFTPRG